MLTYTPARASRAFFGDEGNPPGDVGLRNCDTHTHTHTRTHTHTHTYTYTYTHTHTYIPTCGSSKQETISVNETLLVSEQGSE